MKIRIRNYIIILIFTIILSIPMMLSNFNVYGDDGVQHISRLMGTAQSISEGQIIPVIMSNFCNGFGYSWNIFYSPVTAYIPLIFSIFTSSFELMFKLFTILVVFLSGISMYEFVTKVTKNTNVGLLAAGLYIFSSYRFTDMYMRMAISELSSFIFIPIVFHGMYNIFNGEEKDKKSLLLTLGAAGLIITHIVIAMYTAIFCFVYLLLNIKKLKDKQVIKSLGINIILILLLTSFYTIPMLEHKVTTQYEVFKEGRMDIEEKLMLNKVDFKDLFYTEENNFCFEINLVILVGIVLTILAFKKIDKENRKIYWFSLISGIICVIMSMRFFPFEKLPAILRMLQFSFRLLEFSTFFFAFVVSINYSVIIKNFKMIDTLVLCIVTFLLLCPLRKNINFNKVWSEEKLWPAVEVNENTGRVHAGCATFEYLPSKAYENLDYIKQRENRTYILSGNVTIEKEEKNGTNMLIVVSNIENDTSIELPYIYYLGYNVELQDEAGNLQKIDTYESDNGFIAINLPEGEYGTITVQYTGTILMKISYVVSILTRLSFTCGCSL